MSKKNHSDILTHFLCKLFHAVWKILLDKEYVETHKNGIVVQCHDSIYCYMFPYIFSYSADYREKYSFVCS